MTSGEQTFADFIANRGIEDEELIAALQKAVDAFPKKDLTIEHIERLWYSKEISGLRFAKKQKGNRVQRMTLNSRADEAAKPMEIPMTTEKDMHTAEGRARHGQMPDPTKPVFKPEPRELNQKFDPRDEPKKDEETLSEVEKAERATSGAKNRPVTK